jgi:4-hydroxybenzoate polyprenyltransferase/phosphoserine phosphatase
MMLESTARTTERAHDHAGIPAPPLCVDLDGTLIAGDLLWESVIALMRTAPWLLLLLPVWLCRGKAYLKDQLARRVSLDPAALPYRAEVLDLLRREKEAGRMLVLATASHERLAQAVADHLGLFDVVLASRADRNLRGDRKRQALEDLFGTGGFDYVGDSTADLPVWAGARQAYVVSPSQRLREQARAHGAPVEIAAARPCRFHACLKLLRPHQWAKNLLVFVPLLGAHRLGDWAALLDAGLAFVAFCLCASAIYAVNDLADLEADRKHVRKRRRPLASGAVSIPAGLALAAALLAGSFALAVAALPLVFTAILAGYLAITTWYSFQLKRLPVIDVFALAGLYTIRIIAGGLACSIPVTGWLLGFSTFFFISLALAKRYAELSRMASGTRMHGRGYQAEDVALIRSIGPATGYVAILTLCLYANAQETLRLYSSPNLLWVACFVLCFWITRVWFLAQRQQLDEDPVVFAIKDGPSYVCGAVIAVVLVLAAV